MSSRNKVTSLGDFVANSETGDGSCTEESSECFALETTREDRQAASRKRAEQLRRRKADLWAEGHRVQHCGHENLRFGCAHCMVSIRVHAKKMARRNSIFTQS